MLQVLKDCLLEHANELKDKVVLITGALIRFPVRFFR